MTIDIHLLGGFRLLANGREVVLHRAETRLVAFIADHSGSVAIEGPDSIIATLYADLTYNDPQKHISHLLWKVADVVGQYVDHRDRQDQIKLADGVVVDVRELDLLAGKVRLDTPAGQGAEVLDTPTREALLQIVAWYRGHFLPEFLGGPRGKRDLISRDFQHWVERRQGYYGTIFGKALRMLARDACAQGDPEAVRHYLSRICFQHTEMAEMAVTCSNQAIHDGLFYLAALEYREAGVLRQHHELKQHICDCSDWEGWPQQLAQSAERHMATVNEPLPQEEVLARVAALL